MINLVGALSQSPPASSAGDRAEPGRLRRRPRQAALHPPARRARVPALGGLRGELGRRRGGQALMPDVVAKAMAVITGLLLVSVLAILYVTSRPPAGTREIVAEFRDAFPTLEGMQVRTRRRARRARSGRSRSPTRGSPRSRCSWTKTIPAPKADATATISQADSTGDSYIALRPGHGGRNRSTERDGKPTISCAAPTPTSPCTNTLAAPRFDDLINAFGPPEQAGIKLILQNLSKALDRARRRRQPRGAEARAGARRGQPGARRGQRPERRAQGADHRPGGGERPGRRRADEELGRPDRVARHDAGDDGGEDASRSTPACRGSPRPSAQARTTRSRA